MSEVDHFLGLGAFEIGAAIKFTKLQPGAEMNGVQAEWDMFHRHPARVIRRPAGQSRPKRPDGFEVRGPIVNFLIENRPDQPVLSNVGIKMLQQLRDRLAPADSLVKARFIHAACNMPQSARNKSRSSSSS